MISQDNSNPTVPVEQDHVKIHMRRVARRRNELGGMGFECPDGILHSGHLKLMALNEEAFFNICAL